jgi:drug/metabolite transporter (DMT)-like permease
MKVSWSRFWGIVVGLSGAMALILFNSSTAVTGSVFFASLCVLATVCYAINANSVGHYLQDQHPAAISSAAFMITGGLFVAGLIYSGGWTAAWQHPRGMEGLGYVFYLSALGTVGGSILYFWLLQRNSPLFAASVTYLLPVAAMLLGVLDGESVSVVDIAGTLVILAGLYLARK